MDTLVITNGVIESTHYLADLVLKHENIICADGAVRYLRSIQRLPSIVLGDLDSIDENDLNWIRDNGVPVVTFDVKKDYTDTELAIRYAIEQESKTITLTGALGGRIDHSLGNIYLLVLISQSNCSGIIIEEKQDIHLIDRQTLFHWKIGDSISFVPISPTVEGVTLHGFEYGLEEETLYLGHTRSISNVVVDENQMVTVESGMLLAIRNK